MHPDRAKLTITALLCAAALFTPPAVGADLKAIVDSIRMQGCAGRPAADAPVRTNDVLDEAARRWSRGGRLKQALQQAGYRATSSTSIHVEGTRDDAAIRQVLASKFCAAVNDPQFTEIGTHQRGGESWIVLADPFSPPDPGDVQAVRQRVLELVNRARSEPRRCGQRKYPAAEPLMLSSKLSQAASIHARDMAQHRTLDHRGSEGSLPAQRVTRVGYRWRAVGENIAAGQATADAVVAHWLDSPPHCTNIMSSKFTEMGVAFALAPQSDFDIYWAQVFGAPPRK